jgi:regulation of enolase protein 1 (concanavalin A-like superfamily)
VRLVRAGRTITAQRSVDGSTWTTVGEETVALPATIYIGLAVSSHDATRAATAVFDHVTIGAGALPSGWSESDVGEVGQAGASDATSGSITVKGAGADIWDTADAFHFAYTKLAGDGEIIARIVALTYVRSWTKAGVMIRESLAPDSAHAVMLVSAKKGLAFQRRITTGGLTTTTAGASVTAPYWVKLARSGPTITASASPDGATWTIIGQDSFSMPGTVYAGLAVSSHDPSQTAAATFTNVDVTP